MTYGGGNIVWNDSENLIFIDNLYTRKRKALSVSACGFAMALTTKPHECAVSESLLATKLRHDEMGKKGTPIFIYHLGTNVGVKYVFEEPKSQEGDLSRWLSIRTWGEKIFITTGPSSVHVFSHDGANLSLDHVIDRYRFLSNSPWHGLIRGGTEHIRNDERSNFLPNVHDRDGVFIVMKGLIPGPEVIDPYSHFLVREFSGAEHVATYACDIEETMRGEMEKVFGKQSGLVEWGLAEAMGRAISDHVFGDQGVYEVFRFAFRAHELGGVDLLGSWARHFQVSVTFCTTTMQFGAQSVYIEDGQHPVRIDPNEWVPRTCMLRNGQFMRVYYNSHCAHSYRAPGCTIVSRDISWGGRERTRRLMGTREDLYPLKHNTELWTCHRMDDTLDLVFFHDEDFTVLCDRLGADCVVFDFRESGDEILKLSEVEEGTNRAD